MPEVQSGWTVLALAVVLLHQFAMQWIQSVRHQSNTGELEAIRAELTECRARWHLVEERLNGLGGLFRRMAGPNNPGTNEPEKGA